MSNQTKPKLLNKKFKVLNYTGGDESRIQNILEVDNPSAHNSKEGKNFSLSMKYLGVEGKFSLTNFHIRGSDKDDTNGIKTGLLFVSDYEIKTDHMLQFKDFTYQDFKNIDSDAPDAPILFFTTDQKNTFEKEFKPKWLEGKYIGILFISGGEFIGVQHIILYGFDATTEYQYEVGCIPKKAIPSVEELKGNILKYSIMEFDKNGDGLISAEELAPLLDQMGLDKSVAKKMLEKIGDGEHATIDQVVDFYVSAVNPSSSLDFLIKYYGAVFASYDTDEDGILNREECIQFLKKLSFIQEDSQSDLKHLDPEETGEITFETFEEFIRNVQIQSDQEDLCKGIIEERDTDKDGYLSVRQFSNLYNDSYFENKQVDEGFLSLLANDQGKIENDYALELILNLEINDEVQKKIKNQKKRNNSDKYVIFDLYHSVDWGKFKYCIEASNGFYNNDAYQLKSILEKQYSVKMRKDFSQEIKFDCTSNSSSFKKFEALILNGMDTIGFDLVSTNFHPALNDYSESNFTKFFFKIQNGKKDELEVDMEIAMKSE
eukprot:gene3104-5274_t